MDLKAWEQDYGRDPTLRRFLNGGGDPEISMHGAAALGHIRALLHGGGGEDISERIKPQLEKLSELVNRLVDAAEAQIATNAELKQTMQKTMIEAEQNAANELIKKFNEILKTRKVIDEKTTERGVGVNDVDMPEPAHTLEHQGAAGHDKKQKRSE